jgi:flagellin
VLSLITNTGATEASNSLEANQGVLNQTIAQLSSGKRIVNASDDPAGLAVSLEISGLLGALTQDTTNSANGLGMLQTADGALANIGNALTTMQQLANEAADGTINNTQRSALDSQYQAIFNEVNNIAASAQFNGIKLLTGTSVTFQVGPTDTANDQLQVTMPDVSAGNLLGVALPNATQLFSSGANQNVTITAPGSDTVTLGAGTTASAAAANTVGASATSGELNGQAPNEITLKVTGTTNSSGTGAVGTDSITFVLTDSNGATSNPITIDASNTAIQNVDGLGFDVSFTAADTYKAGDQISFVFGSSGQSASVATQSSAQSQVNQTSNAIASLAQYRGQLGASEQRLQTISTNLTSEQSNMTSALSNIQDANVATTFASFTKQLVLQQTDVLVLKQAEQAPQQLVQLFQ